MNILFTMTGAWGTGSGTVVEAVSRELVQRGHQVQVLYPDVQVDETAGEQVHAPEAKHAPWPFPIEQDGVELYTYPLMIADPNPSNFRNAWTFKDLSEAQLALYISSFQARFEEVVASFAPDLIVCHHVWAMPYAVAQLGYPYLCVAHHSDQMGFHFDERMQPYAIEAARKASFIIAISEGVKEEVQELYGVPEEKVILIENGYDQRVFRPYDVDRSALFDEFGLDIPAEAPVATFAGKLSKTKGVDILLRANRQIQAEVPVHFILFGTGNLDDVLDPELADAYDLTNVHLLGHRPYETIARFHSVARLSVMPSRTEGFGIAGLEAMGCRLPLVITRTGGLDLHAVGAVIDPEDVDALAAAVLRIVKLPEAQYERLCDEALEKARAFSWGSITEHRLKYYRRVAEENPIRA